jgi:glucuronokinase
MQRIVTRALARAALMGNPSDGYYGKTISFTMRDFAARVVLYEWPTLEILPGAEDHVRFDSLAELAADVSCNGYYGGVRLVKASLKKFYDYCRENNVELHDRCFSIRYETAIPRGVGMAGSSAIIVATFRALMQFYEVTIPREILPNWILATERDELRIMAGLQDRVAQVYEGVTFMDFDQAKIERDGFGTYEAIDPQLLPPIYLAYQADLAEVSDIVHNDLRERWDKGDELVHATMRELGELTARAKDCLLNGQKEALSELVDHNFELRRRMMPIRQDQLQMVETARSCGASAHFAGSGGTIVGTYPDESTFRQLQAALGALGCRVFKPQIGTSSDF